MREIEKGEGRRGFLNLESVLKGVIINYSTTEKNQQLSWKK